MYDKGYSKDNPEIWDTIYNNNIKNLKELFNTFHNNN
jgi:hypothetical protein